MPKTKKQLEARLIIFLRDGVIQGINIDKKEINLDIYILDYDVEGRDGEEVEEVLDHIKPFDDPDGPCIREAPDPCIFINEPVFFNKKLVNHYFKEKEKCDKRYERYWKESTEE